ncbi:NAD(P)/FAD-dependent oxidoreductase [Flaviflagellibacter deserti]|uniref:NAD(P)/FAD-dependent oxidoreductase n=1 Tax=Flaviflagellibacter deserti TaxID=2267266 RepID=A0ABV9Z1Q3_9HYPH
MMDVAIIGAGPAGLIASERLAQAGRTVAIYDRMPSPARKFLIAGRGGLNLTHSEPLDRFLDRYGSSRQRLGPVIRAFTPDNLRAWAADLGEPTFVGSSGRVFPKSFKASPLLRVWLRRLAALGVTLHSRHSWTGWSSNGGLTFRTPDGQVSTQPRATLLALGGASWPKLGSDGGWAGLLTAKGVEITPFAPSNSGVRVAWSEQFVSRFAGEPVKRVSLTLGDMSVTGEMMVTDRGLEGGAIYALSPPIRSALAAGEAVLTVDLKPDLAEAEIASRLDLPRRGETASNFLRKKIALSPVQIGLLRESAGRDLPSNPKALARLIKAAPLKLDGVQGLERAISTAGGVAWDAMDGNFMLHALPGTFVAGEMIDWDAPTGGYLLQASFSTGVAAANGITNWLAAG